MSAPRSHLAEALAGRTDATWLDDGERCYAVRDLLTQRRPSTAVLRARADARGIADLLSTWDGGGTTALVPPSEPREGAIARRLTKCVAPPGIATVIATSGSSGTPRLAAHSLAQHFRAADRSGTWLGLETGDRWLLTLPLHHVSGLAVLFRTLVRGAQCALMRDREGLAAALRRARPTHVSLVATQLQRLLDEDAVDALRPVRTILLGGGPVPPALRRRAIEAELAPIVSYGATETCGMLAAEREPEHLLRAGCAGRPIPGWRVALDGRGQIIASGDALFAGYLEGDRLQRGVNDDGSYSTGDVGRLDADGRLYVDGRMDEVFISGGENVHPAEIEAALLELDAVVDAVVVPVEDAEFGHRPAAYLALRPDAPPTAADLRRRLQRRLARFKVPVAFWHLPDTGGLKPARAALRRHDAPRQPVP